MNLGLESLFPKIKKEAVTSFEQMYVAGLETTLAVHNADVAFETLMRMNEGCENFQKIVNVIEKHGVQNTLLDLHGEELSTIINITSGMDKEVALENLKDTLKRGATVVWDFIKKIWKWISEVAAAAWAAIMRQYGMLTGGVKRVTTAKPAERETAVKRFTASVSETNKPSGTRWNFNLIAEFDYYMSYVVGVTSVFEHRMYAEDKLDEFLRNCYKEIKDLSTYEADKVYVIRLKETIEDGKKYAPSTGKVAVMWNKFFTTFIRRYPKHFKKMIEYNEQRGNTADSLNDRFGNDRYEIIQNSSEFIEHNGTPIAEETKTTVFTDKIDTGRRMSITGERPKTLEGYGWTADVTAVIDIPHNFATAMANEMTRMQKEGSKRATQWEALVRQYADKGIDTTALTTIIATRSHTTANYITLCMHCSKRISEMITNVVNYMNYVMDPKTKFKDDEELTEIKDILKRAEESVMDDYVSYHVFDFLLAMALSDVKKEMAKEFPNKEEPVIPWSDLTKDLSLTGRKRLEAHVRTILDEAGEGQLFRDYPNEELTWSVLYRKHLSNVARRKAKIAVAAQLKKMGLEKHLDELNKLD